MVGRAQAKAALALCCALVERLILQALTGQPDEVGSDVLNDVIEPQRRGDWIVCRKPLW